MKPGDSFNPWRLFVGLFVPNALARYTGISPAAKLLYGRLAQYGGKEGDCFPGQDRLASEIGVTDRRIRQLLKELETDKFIKIVRPEGKDRLVHRTSRYEFLWHVIFDGSGAEVNFRSGKEGNFRSYKGTEENQKKENQRKRGGKHSLPDEFGKYSGLPVEVLQ